MTYNEIMQKEGRRISPQIIYNLENTEYIISHDDIIKAKPFFNASLLGTVMKGITIECSKEIPDVKIFFENNARYDNEIKKESYGAYYLKETPQYNADTKTYEHKFYDGFLKTMVDYQPISIEYPTTVFQYFLKLCEKCGFTTNITNLPNGSRIMAKDIYEGIGFTYRNVFDDIGQATASLFQLDEFEIKRCSFGTEAVVINDNILKNQNISVGTKVGPINSVVLARAGDADRIYKRDESLTKWNEYLISENQLMNNNDRDEYLPELYNELYGIEYFSFDLELAGFGIIKPLQKIKIVTGNKEYYSYVFNNEEEFTQGYTQSIYSEPLEGSETNYSASDTTDRRLNQTVLEVNKQKQTIEGLISTVKTVKESIEVFKADIESNNIVIPVTADKKPILTANYDVNYDVFFFGNKITLQPTTLSENTGFTVQITNDYIRFSVFADTTITNLNNKFTFDFTYTDDDGKEYSLSRSIIVCLALSGKDASVESDTEPEDKTAIWYDTSSNQLKKYDEEKETWIVINDYSEEISDIRTKTEDNSTSINNNYQELNKKFDNYATANSVVSIENSIQQLQTNTAWSINRLQEIDADGVKKVVTGNGMIFDENGLTFDRNGAPVKTTVDESGMETIDQSGSLDSTLQYSGYVTSGMAQKNEFLEKYEGQTVNYSKNILFDQYLTSKNWRLEEVEDTEHGTGLGFFYVGGDS